MKKIKKAVDSLQLRYRWFCIKRLRSSAVVLIQAGAPCSNPRLVSISNRILAHGMAVSAIWRNYYRRANPSGDMAAHTR